MTKTPPIFNVIVDAKGVTLRKIDPGRPGYATAKKKIILRERDAIEFFQNRTAAGDSFDGVYSFQFLETAKTFATLRLKAVEQELENNLDRLQAYDGTTKSSGP